MTSEHVRLEREGDVATVTLDRPGTRNACSWDMWMEIRDTFRELAASDVRAIVLTGANGDFCSGADIVKSDSNSNSGWDGNRLTAMRLLGESVIAVHDCPVPTIVKVDGVAVGAGFGLALAGDLLFCSDRARFSAVFAKLGLSLDYGTSWFLTQRIGIHKANEVAFTAEMMDAARADDLGFVNAVVPVDELDAKVADLAARIAAGPPVALGMTKRLLANAAQSSLAHALENEAVAQNVNLSSKDMWEAMKAFKEKRAPVFRGE
jgi:enoyl-CoA hydratase/carnithine racemase